MQCKQISLIDHHQHRHIMQNSKCGTWLEPLHENVAPNAFEFFIGKVGEPRFVDGRASANDEDNGKYSGTGKRRLPSLGDWQQCITNSVLFALKSNVAIFNYCSFVYEIHN